MKSTLIPKQGDGCNAQHVCVLDVGAALRLAAVHDGALQMRVVNLNASAGTPHMQAKVPQGV